MRATCADTEPACALEKEEEAPPPPPPLLSGRSGASGVAPPRRRGTAVVVFPMLSVYSPVSRATSLYSPGRALRSAASFLAFSCESDNILNVYNSRSLSLLH